MARALLRRYIIASHVLLLCCIVHVTVRSTGYYDSIVDFLSNKTCTAVLYNYGFMVFALACRVPVWLFLGRLSQMETEQLMESGRNYLMDAVLFLVLSKPRYNGKEIVITELVKYLAFLVALKCFHILLHLRLSHMFEVEVPGYFKLLRICTFIYTLSMINTFLLTRFFSDLDTRNTFSIWIIFEIFGMLHSCIFCALKYITHIVDFYYENGLANKTTVLFYLELFQDFLSLISFGVFTVVFFVNNPSNIPAYMLIDMLHIAKNLAGRIRMLVQYRLIAKALNQRYPKPTREEIDSGATCIICRDVLSEESRRIDCGHLYHLSCLKSWLFQHSTCPTCRAPIEPDVNNAGNTHFAADPSQLLMSLENRVRELYTRVRNVVVRTIRRAKPRCLFCGSLGKDTTTESCLTRATNFVVGCFAGTPIKCKIGIEADNTRCKNLEPPNIQTQDTSSSPSPPQRQQEGCLDTGESLERVETFDLEDDSSGNGNENSISEFAEMNTDDTVDFLTSTLYRNLFDADGGTQLGALGPHLTLEADSVAASFTDLLAPINLEDDLSLWLPGWVVELDHLGLERIRSLISSCKEDKQASNESSDNGVNSPVNGDAALLEQSEEIEYRNDDGEAPTEGADCVFGNKDSLDNHEYKGSCRMDEQDSNLPNDPASTPISTLTAGATTSNTDTSDTGHKTSTADTFTSTGKIWDNRLRHRIGTSMASQGKTSKLSPASSSPESQSSDLGEDDSKDQRDFGRRVRFTKFLRKLQEKFEQRTLKKLHNVPLDSETPNVAGEVVFTGASTGNFYNGDGDDASETYDNSDVGKFQPSSDEKSGTEATDDASMDDDEIEAGSNLDNDECVGKETKFQFSNADGNASASTGTGEEDGNTAYNHILNMLTSGNVLGLEQLFPIKALQLPQHDLSRNATKDKDKGKGNSNETYTQLLTRVLQSYLHMMNACNLALRCFAEVSSDSKIVERLVEFNNRQRGTFRIGRAKVLLSTVHQGNLHAHNASSLVVSQDSLRIYNDIFKSSCASYKRTLGTMASNKGLQMTLNLTQRLLLNMSTADAIVNFEFAG